MTMRQKVKYQIIIKRLREEITVQAYRCSRGLFDPYLFIRFSLQYSLQFGDKIFWWVWKKKTPEPYQFSTHKYTQSNMLGNFFSFSFPSFYLFSILPKIHSTKHTFRFFFTMILFVYEILHLSHFFCPLFYFKISQNIVLFLK